MAPIINARPGFVNKALTLPLEKGKIKKGDLVTYTGAGDKVRKCDPSEAKYLGIATHDLEVVDKEVKYLTVDVISSQTLLRGTLVTSAQVPVGQEHALTLQEFGLEEQEGELRIAPNGKGVVIHDVLSDGVSPITEVRFAIKAEKLIH